MTNKPLYLEPGSYRAPIDDVHVGEENDMDAWYTSTCGYCGSPTGSRNEAPLSFIEEPRFQRFSAAHIWGAKPRDPRVAALPWHFRRGRDVLICKKPAFDKLVAVVPELREHFRPTVVPNVLELVGRGVEPVGRPGFPVDRAVKKCPVCKSLFEGPRLERELGVLEIPHHPPFFLFETGDVLTLFVRRDVYEVGVGSPSVYRRCAVEVSRKDAVALRPIAQLELIHMEVEAAREMAASIERGRAEMRITRTIPKTRPAPPSSAKKKARKKS